MYVQIAGFVAEFCALGGEIVEQVWVPVGTSDLDPFVARVPRRGVDGFVMNADPGTLTAFLEGVPHLAGPLRGRVVASIGFTASPLPEILGKRLDGVVIGAPDDTETPAAKRWVAAFDRIFPRLKGNEFFFAAFYRDSMEAALRGLEAVGGDLAGGQRRFRDALASLEIDFPTTGRIRLDERRQAIGSNYVVEFVVGRAGIGFRTVAVARNVEQTFNGYFRPDGPSPTTNEIACRKGNAPPWAR
jgi:branched-chain amino acid transport system substrate-binding protein